MPCTPPPLTDEQTQTMRELVYGRTGIWYADSKCCLLAARVRAHMADLNTVEFERYLHRLTSAVDADGVFRDLCSRITINETSFFRNARQLEVFEYRVLPAMLDARHRTRRLRVWSAACSTGEEAYTLALIVRRVLGARFSEWDVDILGTDLSEAALEAARAGLYTQYALRSLDQAARAQFFSEEQPNRFRLDASVRRMVRFDHQNLADAAGIDRRGRWDVVFSRNVLIYFDDAARRRCLASFRRVLAPDGALFLGHSETASGHADFTAFPEPGGFAWSPSPISHCTERPHVA